MSQPTANTFTSNGLRHVLVAFGDYSAAANRYVAAATAAAVAATAAAVVKGNRENKDEKRRKTK